MGEDAMRSFSDIVMPVADYQDVTQSACARPPRPRSIRGKTVALLPNFRVISPAFLESLAQKLQQETDVSRAFLHSTPDWPFNHPEHLGKIALEMDKFAKECDLMVSGVAD